MVGYQWWLFAILKVLLLLWTVADKFQSLIRRWKLRALNTTEGLRKLHPWRPLTYLVRPVRKEWEIRNPRYLILIRVHRYYFFWVIRLLIRVFTTTFFGRNVLKSYWILTQMLNKYGLILNFVQPTSFSFCQPVLLQNEIKYFLFNSF